MSLKFSKGGQVGCRRAFVVVCGVGRVTRVKHPNKICVLCVRVHYDCAVLPCFCGGYSGRETPGLIPNPEAKPACADGTALGRVWESKSLPQYL